MPFDQTYRVSGPVSGAEPAEMSTVSLESSDAVNSAPLESSSVRGPISLDSNTVVNSAPLDPSAAEPVATAAQNFQYADRVGAGDTQRFDLTGTGERDWQSNGLNGESRLTGSDVTTVIVLNTPYGLALIPVSGEYTPALTGLTDTSADGVDAGNSSWSTQPLHIVNPFDGGKASGDNVSAGDGNSEPATTVVAPQGPGVGEGPIAFLVQSENTAAAAVSPQASAQGTSAESYNSLRVLTDMKLAGSVMGAQPTVLSAPVQVVTTAFNNSLLVLNPISGPAVSLSVNQKTSAAAHPVFFGDSLETVSSPIEVASPADQPLEGVVRVNLSELDASVRNILESLSDLGDEVTEDIIQPGMSPWLVAAGALGLGAGYLFWERRSTRRTTRMTLRRGQLTQWGTEGNDSANG
jgi:hypothetical protein